MPSSEYVKTRKLAASSRIAARRGQQCDLGHDLIELQSERAFASGSLSKTRQINALARQLARKLMSGLETWWLTHVIVLCSELITMSSGESSWQATPEDSTANWRPRSLRPKVHSGAEPDLHLSL